MTETFLVSFSPVKITKHLKVVPSYKVHQFTTVQDYSHAYIVPISMHLFIHLFIYFLLFIYLDIQNFP